MRLFIQLLSLTLALTFSTNSLQAQRNKKKQTAPQFSDTLINGLKYRNIGPYRGGRSVAVAGVRNNPFTYYMGTTGGGMWKTEDAGNTWNNISDNFFATGSVGAIGIAESDPNVIYVGMGEHAVRGVMTSHGDGIYKSTDAGATWTHVGLPNSRFISDVIVDPRNPDVVFVAVQGEAYGPSKDKGIYKSTDGGATWNQVLFVNEQTGASSLSMDFNNPRILYAAMWDNQREPWKIRSGGEGSGIWKSTDGGENWTELKAGLPPLMGKIGISVSRANSNRLYAVIEAEGEKGGVYTSTNGGKKWMQVSKDRQNITRAWYYMEIFADPIDEYSVIVCNAGIRKSIDGGKSWKNLPIPHGDTHDVWINPDNNKNYINANDGGGCITFNDGKTWSTLNNQPTAQFYRVNTDNLFPYHLYSGQQDNSSMGVASRTVNNGISAQDWFPAAGGESAYLAFDPNNPQMLYGSNIEGFMGSYDRRTGKTKELTPYPELTLGMAPIDMKYRYNWNPPLIASPHDPNTMYFGANVLLKTTDGGINWAEISGDLTRNQKERQGQGGGPLTNEAAGGENYNTIMYVAESKLEAGVIYVGTDDGLVHLTKDGGQTWNEITPSGMQEGIVNCIDVSVHEPGTAYITLMRYKFLDQTPYIYKTTDYGQSWTLINNGLATDVFVRAIRADHQTKGLLYAGTERGICISFDDGANWNDFSLNMPAVAITDLQIRQNDLAISTAGRGFWILDDLSALQQSQGNFKQTQLFQPKETVLFTGGSHRKVPGRGQNPMNGVLIDYCLADNSSPKDLRLHIMNAEGQVIRTFTGIKDSTFKRYPGGPSPAPRLSAKPGVNRFAWDFKSTPIKGVQGQFIMANYNGETVTPGMYTIALVTGSDSLTTTVKVIPDPRLDATAEDFRATAYLMQEINQMLADIHATATLMREAKAQIKARNQYISDNKEYAELKANGTSILKKIDAWEAEILSTQQTTFQDVINFENQLSAELMFLKGYLQSHDPRMTTGALQRFKDLQREWMELQNQVDLIIQNDIDAYNAKFKELGVQGIILE